MTVPVGGRGESQAARHLEKQGLLLLDRHFHTRWGEVDLIFKQKDTIVFVEVKTRSRQFQPTAADAVTPAKQRRLVQAALSYVKKHHLEGHNLRFDVVLIEGERLEWISSAFEPADDYTL